MREERVDGEAVALAQEISVGATRRERCTGEQSAEISDDRRSVLNFRDQHFLSLTYLGMAGWAA
jgi:hypothetical protein